MLCWCLRSSKDRLLLQRGTARFQGFIVAKAAKKMAEIPVMPFVGRLVDVLVVLQEQVPTLQKVQKTVEFAEAQYDSMVDVPVVLRRQATTIQTEEKILNVTGTPCLYREVDVPVVMQQQTPMIRKVQTVHETAPQTQHDDEVIDVPIAMQRKVFHHGGCALTRL